MDRRQYLGALVVGTVASLAGCAGDGNDGEDGGATSTSTVTTAAEQTPTDTTPTDTTPTDTTPTTTTSTETRTSVESTTTTAENAPELLLVNPVYEFEEYGDVEANAITASSVSAGISIGYRYAAPRDDVRYGQELVIRDDAGERVLLILGNSQYESGDGTRRENAIRFESYQAKSRPNLSVDEGTYTATVRLTEGGMDTLASATTEFALRPELSPGDVSVVDVESPERLAVDENFSVRVVLASSADVDGGFTPSVSFRSPGSEEWREGRFFSHGVVLPGGGRNDLTSDLKFLGEPGTYEFRIDDLGTTWTIEATG